jgi:hypothetical protein
MGREDRGSTIEGDYACARDPTPPVSGLGPECLVHCVAGRGEVRAQRAAQPWRLPDSVAESPR